MKYKNIIIVNLMVVLGLLMFAGISIAQGIKDRMKQRLPVIVELKTKGIVGENNSGYLAFVTGQKSHEQIIASENKDRKTIYSHIAKQQNTSLRLVEKRRALILAERAMPGEFIQKADGAWIKKK
ncbi:MAG: YdbL family protein [Desulfobacteraceae bacterium]|nr:YdbL family protein [Desulfobacteraceae bacterium]